MNLTDIKGIGQKKSELLNELGIYSIIDLIEYMPIRYEDRSKMTKISDSINGVKQYYQLEITKISKTYFYGGNKTISRVSAKDETGEISIVWHNNRFIVNSLKIGEKYKFYGYFDTKKKSLINPIYSKIEDDKIGGIIPIYSIKKGLSEKNIIDFKNIAIKNYIFNDYIDSHTLNKNNILSLKDMYLCLNNPSNSIELYKALFSYNLRNIFLEKISNKIYRDKNKENYIVFDSYNLDNIINRLEFDLTSSQNAAIKDIINDMTSDKQMNRIIIGDVGSGKTIIAILSAIFAVKNNYQVAFMSPTEILAIQHYEKYKDFFKSNNINTSLLIGSTPNTEKMEIYNNLKYSNIDILFGTHALFQEKVDFAKLGLVITDEQQRFGVKQRRLLYDKGEYPDTLLLSATPIPRTLALSMYNELDISFINTMPRNRKQIKSYLTSIYKEKDFINFAYNRIIRGEQVYIVTSRVEEDENLESVERLYNKLTKYFNGNISIDYLHGQMTSEEKESKQKLFYAGKIDLLIATSIIEVGIDNPNATVMIIYDSNQFGLSQLHQIRGRVGRSSLQSYCFFVIGDNNSSVEKIEFIANNDDGFEIAKKDLELRGSGEMYGANQSGFIEIDNSFMYNENLLNLCDKLIEEIDLDNIYLQREISKRLYDLERIILN